jgi:holliday junction DNA helicase ruvA
MIEYIKGTIAQLTPTYMVIETAGIGYGIEISVSTFDSLQGKESARIFIHEIIREDAHLLFGFGSAKERELFRLLIGVSGVGANTARTVLSALPPSSLETAISQGDVNTLKSVKGVGAKTAERIIVDLRDKIKPGDDTLLNVGGKRNETFEEALAALVMLGFQRQASVKALKKIYDADPLTTAEKAIKKALSMM